MSFMPIMLWSDALVFLLLSSGIATAWYIRQREHLLLPWRRVAQSATAMVSLLVLSLFFAVGLLDTLHYRAALPETNGGEKVYSPEVLSVFDKLVEPLRLQTEKTYSAPYALTLYAKESMSDARGNVVHDYPRLRYGGAHLADVSQRDGDLLKRALLGGLGGLLAGLLITLGCRRWLAQRGLPLRALLVATLILAALLGASLAENHIAQGTALLQAAVLAEPGRASWRVDLGDAYARAGRGADARRQYAAALELEPGLGRAHNNLGLLLAKGGLKAEALVHYRAALRDPAVRAEAHYNRGNAHLEEGGVRDAERHYRRALDLAPGFTRARINLGNSLARRGAFREAAALYRAALKADPLSLEARANLGAVAPFLRK